VSGGRVANSAEIAEIRARAEGALHSNARWIKTPQGGTTRDRKPGTREVDQMARDVLALVEAVEAAQAVRMLPHLRATRPHFEADEISCVCGFEADGLDYDSAREALRHHLVREDAAADAAHAAAHTRLEEALSRFSGGGAG